jgi:hypothetical protein
MVISRPRFIAHLFLAFTFSAEQSARTSLLGVATLAAFLLSFCFLLRKNVTEQRNTIAS